MAKYFPEDGIFYSDEELLLRDERGYSDMSDSLYDKNDNNVKPDQADQPRGAAHDKSAGAVTRLERLDIDYGRKYLRK